MIKKISFRLFGLTNFRRFDILELEYSASDKILLLGEKAVVRCD